MKRYSSILSLLIAGWLLLCLPSLALSDEAALSDGATVKKDLPKKGRPDKPIASFSVQYEDLADLSSFRFEQSGDLLLAKIGSRRLVSSLSLGTRQTDSELLPRDLYSIAAKLSLRNRTDRVELGISSNSDKPFYSNKEISWHLMAVQQAKKWQQSMLNLGLFYTNRFEYPLPVITWVYFSEKMQIVAGFPIFRFSYHVTAKDTFKISYKPIQDVDIGYTRTLNSVEIGLSGVVESDGYFIADRIEKDNSTVFETISVRLHAKKLFKKHWEVKATAGYIVNARTYEGEDIFSIGDSNNLGSGWLTGLYIGFKL